VELDGRYLSVRGVRPDVAERRAYHQMEIRSGEFSTEVEIPAPVNASAVEAIYDNGILRILLPKSTPNPAR
jgi:HSP20 family protein